MLRVRRDIVDQHAVHAARQLVAQDARGQRQVLVDQLTGARAQALLLHVLPEAAQVLDVFANALDGRALRRGAHDVAAGDLLRHGLG